MSRTLRSIALTALLTVLGSGACAGTALAATATSGNLRSISIREDGFYNYDFTSPTVAADKVDWAVALMFYNNASINRVKNSGVGPLYDQTGSTMRGRLSENTANGFLWDNDGGRKTTKCPGAPGNPRNARHYRIYADGDDRLYNLSWGYWVYGTTHWDMDECSLFEPAVFGYSETAEDQLVADWSARTGWPAFDDWAWFSNPEPFRVQGDHVWDSNGYASALRVG